MSEKDKQLLEDIATKIKPGDILIFRAAKGATQEQIRATQDALGRWGESVRVETLLLSAGVKLEDILTK